MSRTHREYFNHLAAGWPGAVEDESQFISWLADFGVEPGDRILDVGAGKGILTHWLQALGSFSVQTIPLDLSEQMLILGKRSQPQALHSAVCSNIEYAAFHDNLFDKAICYSVFPHITRPVQAGRELYRLLKPGGRLLVLHSQCSRKLNLFHAQLADPVMHDTLMPAVDLQALFLRLGFLSVRVVENPQLYWVEVAKPPHAN
ncbi:class I SAM-dependent methyltransferase [bacterium]|nr:class I SAM-dependent methyltransferase [bacterium]